MIQMPEVRQKQSIKKVEEFAGLRVKIGKLKYMYTMHDTNIDIYEVVYYGKQIDEEHY